MKELSIKEAFTRAASYCSRAEHCRSEVYSKLQSWGIKDDAIETIIDRLENESYLDDLRFAKAFAHDRSKFSGWGKTKIAWQLKARMIDQSAIKEALDEIDRDEYIAKMNDALQAKARSLKEQDTIKRNAKLLRFGINRGFEYELVAKWISAHNEV